MIHRKGEFDGQWETERSPATIFGEGFSLESGLREQLEPGWRLEGYIDSRYTEHIRITRKLEAGQQTEELWEALEYPEEESPLELLADDITT